MERLAGCMRNKAQTGPRRTRLIAATTALALVSFWAPPAWGAPATGSGRPVYTVKRGDTLSSIARRLKIPLAQLADRNSIVDGNIYAGTSIFTDVLEGQAPASSDAGYIVRKGDTLTSIARKLNLNPVALAARNGIIEGRLYFGARLLTNVSAAGRPPAPARPYVVKGEGSSGAFRCPVLGKPSFLNDWGFARGGGRRHEGNDLLISKGTPVVAPVPGTVTREPNRLGGKAVFLRDASGRRYYFAHLDSYGATGPVPAGTVIGRVGTTGNAEGTSPRLHFGMQAPGNGAVNPFPTLSLACR